MHQDGKFHDKLKKVDISLVFKEGSHNDKTNYR